ncbi:hypothetical protein D3C75_696920 [compost metagenome]
MTNGSEMVRMRLTNKKMAAIPATSAIHSPLVRNSRSPVVPIPRKTAPSASNEPRLGNSFGSRIRNSGTSSRIIAVTANSQFQPKYWVIAPPATGPSPKPSETEDIIVAIALPRRPSGTYRVNRTSDSDMTAPAPEACIIRTISRKIKFVLRNPAIAEMPSVSRPMVSSLRIGRKSESLL